MVNNLTDVEINSISGDVADGGWQIHGTVYNDADALSENERVQLYVRAKLDGDWDTSWVRRFVGYCLPQDIRRYHDRSMMTFSAQTSHAYLRRGRVQGIYFTEQVAPANEHQMTGLKSGKVVDHIIDKHTNMGPATPAPNGWIDLTDIDETNSADMTVLSVHEGIIWERITQLAKNEFYIAYFDKEDKFHYIPHPTFNTPLPDTTMVWDSDFITEPLEVKLRTDRRVKQVILRALQDPSTIISSLYPAQEATVEPEAYGEKIDLNRLRCNTQALLDTWAERRYQWENRDYTVVVRRPGLVGCWFELMDVIELNDNSAADGISFVNEKFFIHKINMTYDPKTKSGQTTFTLEQAADTSL